MGLRGSLKKAPSLNMNGQCLVPRDEEWHWPDGPPTLLSNPSWWVGRGEGSRGRMKSSRHIFCSTEGLWASVFSMMIEKRGRAAPTLGDPEGGE